MIRGHFGFRVETVIVLKLLFVIHVFQRNNSSDQGAKKKLCVYVLMWNLPEHKNTHFLEEGQHAF